MNKNSYKHQLFFYKHSCKWDDQQYFKDILEAAMVSTPEGFINDSPISPMTSSPVKKPSARKSLCLVTKILDVKKKTATRQVGSAKSKRKAIKYGNTPWALKQNIKLNSKINDQIKKSLYNWIIHHPQVVKSPITNDCLKVEIDSLTEPQLVPKLLVQVSVREPHKTLLLTQTMVDSKKQQTQKIRSSSVILHYVHYCHPN